MEDSTKIVLGIFAFFIFIIAIWMVGLAINKSGISRSASRVDEPIRAPMMPTVRNNVKNLMCDWAASCPMGKYGSPGGPTFQLPHCDGNFNPVNMGYSSETIDALDEGLKILKDSWPGPRTKDFTWRDTQSHILQTL